VRTVQRLRGVPNAKNGIGMKDTYLVLKRRDLLKIEVNEIRYPTIEGTELYSIPTETCAAFLSILPRPTVEELTVVLNPICYLGPYDYNHHNHNGTCSNQIYCCPGWIPIPDKPGLYDYDKKIFEERVRRTLSVDAAYNRF